MQVCINYCFSLLVCLFGFGGLFVVVVIVVFKSLRWREMKVPIRIISLGKCIYQMSELIMRICIMSSPDHPEHTHKFL